MPRIAISRVNRFFNLLFGGIAMLIVIVLAAFITMRVAIHGGQVEVPDLAGLTVADATRTTSTRGLNLVLTSRFYSTTVAAGHIISQTPAPGVIVRHEWEIRAIESLGPQQVSIPDVSGLGERLASMNVRRVSLELGTVAHLPAPGDPDIVLAQTPPPNAGGVDSPRVSLLLSQKDDARAAAFVMPSFVGLSMSTAASRAAALGLYVYAAAPAASSDTSAAGPDGTPVPAPAAPAEGIVSSQSPAAGHRVTRGEGVRLTLGG